MRRLRVCAIALVLSLVLALPSPAQAMDRRAKSFLFWSAIGLGAGTAVGFATLPIHQSLQGAFVGSSVGLYLGIVMGIYFVFNIDQDPIFYPPTGPGGAPPQAALPAQSFASAREPALVQWSYPVLRF